MPMRVEVVVVCVSTLELLEGLMALLCTACRLKIRESERCIVLGPGRIALRPEDSVCRIQSKCRAVNGWLLAGCWLIEALLMQCGVSASPGCVLYALTFLADDLIANVRSHHNTQERRKTLDLTLNGETVP
jgi:hypothetical protein